MNSLCNFCEQKVADKVAVLFLKTSSMFRDILARQQVLCSFAAEVWTCLVPEFGDTTTPEL
jgi:hypothetical protein